MSCEYVQEYYGVPAEIGRRITFQGRPGIIAEDHGHYIGVNFDDEEPGVVHNVHPTDGVEYLDMGRIRKPSRSKARYLAYLKVADCFESFREYLQYETRRKHECEEFSCADCPDWYRRIKNCRVGNAVHEERKECAA